MGVKLSDGVGPFQRSRSSLFTGCADGGPAERDGPRLHNEATSRERFLFLRGKEMYENVGIFGSRVSHRVGWRGVAVRTVACPEVFELSDQVAIPLTGKPRYVTLT